MTDLYEPPKIVDRPAAAAAPRARAGGLLPALLVFLLLLGIALGLGALHRQQAQHDDALTAQIATLRAQAALSEQSAAALQARVQAAESALATLSAAQQGDRQRLQLTLVEHLLLSANERLRLARDASGAQLALELAEKRLGLLEEPRLLKLRETIARERGALAGLPRVDLGGAVLSLAALVESAAAFPLAARAPDHFEPVPVQTPEPAPVPTGWWASGWAQVRQALGAMFSVRRARGPAPRLLAPEEEAQVQQILLLRLESVRVAVLRGQQPALRETAAAAARWLRQHYNSEDAGVRGALEELQRLGALPLDAEPPDISGSLALLRAELGRQP